MPQLNQPSNQIKLTNVSVVKSRKRGKRYEIACYKNKVLEWRNGIEKDLDQVVQIHSVFTNVSRGQIAPTDDLRKCFGTDDTEKIILEILQKGELQIGEKERQHQLNSMYRDIVQIISEKCVNPTKRCPYTTGIIDKALQEIGFSVQPNRPAKLQAWDAIKELQETETLAITRARIRIRVQCNIKDSKKIKGRLHELVSEIENENFENDYEMICYIEPGSLRLIDELLKQDTRGHGQLEVLDMHEGRNI